MTENKALESALEKVKAQKVNFGFLERFDVDENWEVMKALEEVQAYRAIGTVEELKSLKENGAFTADELVQLACIQMYLKDYQSIGTVEEFKALKEKSVAKKAKYDNDDEIYICPTCEKRIGEHQNYCWNCGQAFKT